MLALLAQRSERRCRVTVARVLRALLLRNALLAEQLSGQCVALCVQAAKRAPYQAVQTQIGANREANQRRVQAKQRALQRREVVAEPGNGTLELLAEGACLQQLSCKRAQLTNADRLDEALEGRVLLSLATRRVLLVLVAVRMHLLHRFEARQPRLEEEPSQSQAQT